MDLHHHIFRKRHPQHWIPVFIVVGVAAVVAVLFLPPQTISRVVPSAANQNGTVLNRTQPLQPGEVAYRTVAEVTADPTTYHNRTVCVAGAYYRSDDTNVLGSSQDPETGVVESPLIWVGQQLDAETITCGRRPDVGEVCTGVVTVCGVFSAATPNGPQFGPDGTYAFELR